MSKDWFDKEIESWEGYLSGLRRPDSDIFRQMINEARDYKDAVEPKENISTEALLMALILRQQKIINSLIEKYQNK